MSSKKHKNTNKRKVAKQNDDSKYLRGTFSLLSSTVFRIGAIVAFLFGFLLILSIGLYFQKLSWDGTFSIIQNVVSIVFVLILAIIIVLFAFLLWKSAEEIEHESDKQFIVAVFSGITSLAAVIVAFIALIKGA